MSKNLFCADSAMETVIIILASSAPHFFTPPGSAQTKKKYLLILAQSMAAFSSREPVQYTPTKWDSLFDIELINGRLFPKMDTSYSVVDPFIECFQDDKGRNQCLSIINYGPHIGSTYVCIYFHGNASDLGDSIERMKCYSQWMNCVVFGIEYSGYGCSAGELNQEFIINKCVRSIEYISRSFNIPLRKMILFGHSIGAALVMKMNDLFHQGFGAIIIQSAFTNIKDVAVSKGVTFSSFISADLFSNINSIRRVSEKQMVLIIHGEKDELIPVKCARMLYAACPLSEKQKFLFIDKMSSHNAFDKLALRLSIIIPFIQKCDAVITERTKPCIKVKLNQLRFYNESSFAVLQIMYEKPKRPRQKDCWIGSGGLCIFDTDLSKIKSGSSKDSDLFNLILGE